jgi:hypothetical protein
LALLEFFSAVADLGFARVRFSKMQPLAMKRPAAAKRLAWVGRGNNRRRAREAAVKALNTLALEHGLPQLPVKSSWRFVQRFIRKVQAASTCADAAARLFTAASAWCDNGGHLEGTLAPAQPAPPSGMDGPMVPKHKVFAPRFRLRSHAFMLTYNSKALTKEAWPRLHTFTADTAQRLGTTAWAACLEETSNPTRKRRRLSSKREGVQVYHGHAYYFWDGGAGLDVKNTDDFVFEGCRPRVDTCSVRNPLAFKVAAHHGLWYVNVHKKGSVKEATNYPPWRAFFPKKEWLVALWAQRKLDHDEFEKLSVQFRDGHAVRMQELAAVRRSERADAVRRLVEEESAHVARVPPRFKVFAEVDNFIRCFEPKVFLDRRPIFVIIGATNLGKSILAVDILRRVGLLLGLASFKEITVEGDSALDLSEFDVARDAGVNLDGVGDAAFLHYHRESLQGRAKESRGGRSTTMMYAYPYTLCRRAVVATMDLSAANLELFETHHWLSDTRNVIPFRLTESVFESTPAAAAPSTFL